MNTMFLFVYQNNLFTKHVKLKKVWQSLIFYVLVFKIKKCLTVKLENCNMTFAYL